MNWVCDPLFFTKLTILNTYKTVVKTYFGIRNGRLKRRNVVTIFYYRWHHILASVTFSISKVIRVIVTLFFFHFVACFRFSLLLLEPAEIYFEDFSAFMFPLDADEHDFEKKKQIGRLKMCSKSIVFDPKDINRPLIKIPLKDCISISEWDGELASRYDILIYAESLPLCCIY